MKLPLIVIAATAHNVIREFCAAAGAPNYPAWDETNAENRERTIAGVREVIESRPTHEEQHELWTAKMLADAWTFGEDFDIAAKTHPGLVSYGDLPQIDREKQAIFRAIVNALR